MKFTAFKEFRGIVRKVIDDPEAILQQAVDYLSIDMTKTLRELQLGLVRLNFDDNFESFTETVTIAASSELAIQNKLKDGIIPSKRIIVRGGTGAENIVDGDTEWSSRFVYLKNQSLSPVTVTVIFLR